MKKSDIAGIRHWMTCDNRDYTAEEASRIIDYMERRQAENWSKPVSKIIEKALKFFPETNRSQWMEVSGSAVHWEASSVRSTRCDITPGGIFRRGEFQAGAWCGICIHPSVSEIPEPIGPSAYDVNRAKLAIANMPEGGMEFRGIPLTHFNKKELRKIINHALKAKEHLL